MKKVTNSILALCAVFMFTVGTSYASFPVKSDSKKQEVKEQVSSVDAPAVSESTVKASEKASTKVESANANDLKKSAAMDDEKLITLLLWFFLGGLAAHRWYRGKPVGWNILFILTGGGCFVWAIVDLINILTDKF
jgi:TM2 domain